MLSHSEKVQAWVVRGWKKGLCERFLGIGVTKSKATRDGEVCDMGIVGAGASAAGMDRERSLDSEGRLAKRNNKNA